MVWKAFQRRRKILIRTRMRKLNRFLSNFSSCSVNFLWKAISVVYSERAKKVMRKRIALAYIIFLQLNVPALAGPKTHSPNLILIMADDLGYHDVSSYGHPKIKTPVLDRLAQEGVKLTSFYAGATVCTPSRMALLTGAYPTRLGWSRGVVGHIMKKGQGLSPDALTMPEIFRDSGYRTAMFGKWHLGDDPSLRPHRQGFDTAFYLNKSNNQTKKLWRADEVIENPFTNRLLSERFTTEAIKFIESNQDHPFFLYLPHTAPHFPLEAHPDWKGKSQFGVFGDVVEELDHRIGQILESLKSTNLEKNTIVVFLSDNGPEPLTKASRADPFRGKKWSALEGGTRVPCIIRYPGHIPPGRESADLISAIDLLPSLAHACGIDLRQHSRDKPVIDGLNVWPTLQGSKGVPHARQDLLYWHGADGFQAIRKGPWKLFPDRRHAGLKGLGPALFNLESDLKEEIDVSMEHPVTVAKLKKLAELRLSDIEKNKVALGGTR
ncbi:MAG: arylsulfatase [Roseibacillus sp.]|nr:arylsulfatase [Roseibacillus sp.]